ncbi:extracellular calcium-sensing receptor-like [Ictalurus punctatus]|uniref:Extracellular calcium-sensing receptor-like n=1 Tax=Ictalurus punctatus TaxID=7998 RepID=A0A2D0QSP9_ICTPU|nr:extracellular calcium-sensing receptor-like [Ictalurus punctatus]
MTTAVLSVHLFLLALLLWVVCEVVVGTSQQEKCVYLDRARHLDTVGLSQDGDVIIGALINFYMLPPALDLSFTKEPYLQSCYEFQESPVQWAQAVVFAVEEINRNPSLLPGVRLGYRIMDSCSRYPHSLRSVMSIISGGNGTCETTRSSKIIIGDSTSTQCMILSRVLSPLYVPMISYLATCVCLSNKRKYPNFFRTIPSDMYQARTMAQMAKRFGWTWVGAVVEENDYGLQAVQAFMEETKGTGICLAFVSTIFRERLAKDVDHAVTVVQSSSARVIMVFVWDMDLEVFLTELVRRNVTDRQFLASEIWSTSSHLLSNVALYTITQGTLGVAVRSAPIPGFEKHLQELHPSRYPQDTILRVLWERTFGCSPVQNNMVASQSGLPPCSGKESLEGVQNGVTDVSNLRTTYNVYLAVYAAAYALHSLLTCTAPNSSDPTVTPGCSSPDIITTQQLLEHLKMVNFTTQLGEKFYFQDGETPAVYDIVNWQRGPGGTLQYVLIGRLEGSNLIINESAISWPGNSNKVPVSVCTAECPHGTRKAIRKGLPVCCFDCLPCAEGEFSNVTGSLQCYRCPPEFWSNSLRTACVPREVEYLAFNETMGITLTTVAVCGAMMTAAVGVVFVYYRQTPIVKANNSELSFLLLLSLKLCFLCSLVFVGQPSLWSCRLQQAAFGISFVLCISCILVKTIVVLVAFRSARPGSAALMKWFGPGQQRGSVLFFTCIQVIICAVWLSLSPPFPHRNLSIQGSKIILECMVGSVTGFSLVLGYIGLLAAICFLLAFFARKLPDNFNEAKFITFSMLIFCAVWITFVPAYISSPGKYSVAVEIFAILASSFGVLICIFAPKCYIILLRPEKNTKKFLMGKTQ